MSYFLQLDGVDDYVRTPSITFNRAEMEFSAEQHTKATQFYINARDGAPLTYLERQVNGTDYGSLLSGFRLNGVNKQNSTAYIPFDERVLLTFNCNNVSTARVNFFSSQSGTNCMKGNLYMIKLYHNNTLVAHYDMSLGNVQDQSGNGNHATLNGGIWISTEPESYPEVEIISISKPKISKQEDMSPSIIKLKFSKDIVEYVAKLNGVDYSTGSTVHEGGSVLKGEETDVIVDWYELDKEGENRINIYGKDSKGNWTPYENKVY